MNNHINYLEEDIKSLVKCQRIIRNRMKDIREINKTTNICYNSIYSIMKRIHSNFVLGITSQYEYNFNNVKLDEELESFITIPRPLTLRDLKIHSIDYIRTTIYTILFNLIDITKRVGINSIFDSLSLITKQSLKKTLLHFNDKDKTY